jgi:hypothetical protein
MRSCSFADNFVTLTTIEENMGSDGGTGNTANRGLSLAGTGWLAYDKVRQPGDFSVTFSFRTSTTHTNATAIIATHNVITGPAVDGFTIWVDPARVYANHSNGVSKPTACGVVIDYADGEWHTVTYIVNMTAGTHSLYVDSLAVDTETTTINEEISDTNVLNIGRVPGGSTYFTGDVHKVRIFDAVLTEEEHDFYRAGSMEDIDWFQNSYAAYRCDDFCNDTAGHYVWDKSVNKRDLAKADRVTTSKFPAFQTNRYFFDKVDDYLGAMPTLPSTYTITAAKSSPQLPYPRMEQDNDTSFTALLVASGGFWGYLHGMVIHSGVLTQLQLYQDEYQHLYWLNRGRALPVYHRFITEETCQLAMFLDSDYWVYRDYSQNFRQGIAHDVTRAADGCTFDSADSNIEVYHHSGVRLVRGTIVVYGDFSGSVAAGTIVDKGTNYKLRTNGNQLDFNGSTIAHTFANNEQIAVTFKPGYDPQFYVDGEYIGDGTANYNGPSNDCTDGDMELAGVANWTADGASVLTKDTTNKYQGAQSLKIEKSGADMSCTQAMMAVNEKKYRVRGWAKGDGTSWPAVTLNYSPYTTMWTGTTSTSWQYFDFTLTTGTGAGKDTIKIRGYGGSGGNYVNFDSIISEEIADVIIGNNNETNERTRYEIAHVYIGDETLTQEEIQALWWQSGVMGDTSMETGNRTRVRQVFTATAVDEDVDPGGPFQLIDISINFNTAPTTSEDISITSINSDTDAVVEAEYDPSLSSDTSHVFRFDKRFPDGTTIAVDYTNTDGRTITVNTTYQTDESVT